MRATLIVFLMMLNAAMAYSATITVPGDYGSIQEAISAAGTGDTVLVSPDTYFENIDFLGKAITVTSSDGPYETVIDGGLPADPDLASVVYFHNSEGNDSVLEGFTITNGAGTYIALDERVCGGGIYCDGASPTIRDNVITKNTIFSDSVHTYGGGICCSGYNASTVISDNKITDNRATASLFNAYGGGIACLDDSTPIITGNFISENVSDYVYNSYHHGTGGGIYSRSDPIISNNVITFNHVEATLPILSGGGGIYGSGTVSNNLIMNNSAVNCWGGGVCYGTSVDNNVICGNTGASGGGLHNCDSMTNNLIFNNTASSAGGGILCSISTSHTVVIANNTIYNNSSSEGAGIYYAGGTGSRLNIENSIVWGNHSTSGYDIWLADAFWGSEATISYSDIDGGQSSIYVGSDVTFVWGSGNIDANPLFMDPLSDYLRLQQNPCQPGVTNPCVDAGDPATPMITGTTRSDGVQDSGVVDMGYHHQPMLPIFVPDDYLSIQLAINASADGDFIIVKPGIYAENVHLIGKAVQLISTAGPEDTVIDAQGSGCVVNIDNFEGPDTVIRGFTLTNGLAGEGAGIRCFKSAPTILDNIIIDNMLTGSNQGGAGIFCYLDDPWIEGNQIVNNVSGRDGGGLYCQQSSPTLINNLIDGNTAKWGGGLYCYWDANPRISNCTITENEATGESNSRGGALFSTGSCVPVIVNSILWNNRADYLDPEIHTTGTVDVSYSVVKGGFAGANVLDADPAFVDPGTGDFDLTDGSPCINRGTNDGAPLDDLHGDVRPCMGTADMGADEYTGHHRLEADTFTLSESLGGIVNFELDAGGANAGRTYLLVTGVTGTIPGTALPKNLATLPVIWDWFTDFFEMPLLNTVVFLNFLGTLDPSGQATAQLNPGPLPPGSGVGIKLYFAYCLNNPFDFVSNPIVVEIVP